MRFFQIEEQRKYLGGDATHSILVKGLDYALLAARKAEIEATEGKKAEDELDALFEGETAAVGASKAGENVQEKSSGVGRKRTREEIVQQLKRQRTGAAVELGESVAPVQETLGSKVS
jgi:IK cytokine